MSHRIWISASLGTLLAVLAPFAQAGTRDDPEIADPPLDALGGATNAYADIVAAWFEPGEDGGVRATIELTALPPPQAGVGYGVMLSAGDETRFAALVMTPGLSYWIGSWDYDNREPAGEPRDITGSHTLGPGARIVLDIPDGELPDNVTALTRLQAAVLDFKAELTAVGPGGLLFLDEASGSRDYPLAAPANETLAGEAAAAEPETSSAEALGPAAVSDADEERAVPGPSALLGLAAALAIASTRPRKA